MKTAVPRSPSAEATIQFIQLFLLICTSSFLNTVFRQLFLDLSLYGMLSLTFLYRRGGLRMALLSHPTPHTHFPSPHPSNINLSIFVTSNYYDYISIHHHYGYPFVSFSCCCPLSWIPCFPLSVYSLLLVEHIIHQLPEKEYMKGKQFEAMMSKKSLFSESHYF